MKRVALALLLGLAPARGQDPRPATGPRPDLPPAELLRDAEPLGSGTPLERNGGVAGSLFATGQSCVHPLEARAGELVLLDLYAAGFARGWSAIAHIEVRDPQGRLVLDRVRRGGVEFAAFTGFRAESEGLHQVRLQARDGSFRYALVRHADFAPRRRGDPALAIGEREELFGYLLHDGDQARYELELEAGECVALSVASTVDKAIVAERARKREEGPASVLAGEVGRSMGMEMDASPDSERPVSEKEPRMGRTGTTMARRGRLRDRGAATGLDWPRLALTLEEAGGPLAAPSHYTRFTAPHRGRYVVRVHAVAEGQGGLFRLQIEREPRLVALRGQTFDAQDEPLAGVRLAFLREPDLDPEGQVTSGSDGHYSLRLRPGPYTILVQDPDGQRETLRTHVEEEDEVNVLVSRGGP